MFLLAGGDSMQNVHCLQPIPSETGVNPWQLKYPVTHPQSVPAVLGPQEFNWSLSEHEKL